MLWNIFLHYECGGENLHSFCYETNPTPQTRFAGGAGVCLELLFLSVWDPSKKSIKSLGKGEWGHFGKPGLTHFRLLSVRLSSFSHLLLQKKDFLFFPPPPKKTRIFLALFFW